MPDVGPQPKGPTSGVTSPQWQEPHVRFQPAYYVLGCDARIKAIEYYPNGTSKWVEFYDDD